MGTTETIRAVPSVTVPGDKSISHRALILAALADGTSRIRGLLDAADTRSTATALRALGVEVPADWSKGVEVRGSGLSGLARPSAPLDCGNSGTTARLLLGALAGCPLEAVLTGDASLLRRPMRRITAPLSAVGAEFEGLGEPDRLPVRVRGRRPLDRLDVANHRSSAQVKTAMLLAGLTGATGVRVTEPAPSRDHSERLLKAMGAAITTGRAESEIVVTLEGTDRLEPIDLKVPGDLSSAAYFLALGALRGELTVVSVGTNPTRTGVLDVLRRMGVPLEVTDGGSEAGEPVGQIRVGPGTLTGAVVSAEEVPRLIDEVPVLAVLAARADGETRLDGVGELRVKESDRIEALVRNLKAIGVEAEAGPAHLVVRGTDRPLRGAVDAFGDHRIAMAFGVLAALPENEITIRGREAVAISYPGFWSELDRIHRALEGQ